MATSTYGTPYVQGSDLVSAYPTASSNLATRVDEVSYKRNGLNAQTGTTYTLVAGDAGKTITLSNASAVAVTLPQDSTADLPDGAVVSFYNLGAGTVTISQGTGATLQGGSITLVQYEVMSVIKLSANTYGKFDSKGSGGVSIATPSSIAYSGGSASSSAGTTTFTGVSSISLNGVFTTPQNYIVVCNGTGSSTTLTALELRLRASGTDESSNLYYRASIYWDNGAGPTRDSSWPGTKFLIGNVGTKLFHLQTQIFSPKENRYTGFLSQSGAQANTGNQSTVIQGQHEVNYQADGLTIIPGSGTITGTIRVYSYEGA